MQKALHIKTKVLPGKKIEIQAPELTEGDTVDIFVIAPQEAQKVSALDILEKVHKERQPKTAAEIDEYLREERNSWDF